MKHRVVSKGTDLYVIEGTYNASSPPPATYAFGAPEGLNPALHTTLSASSSRHTETACGRSRGHHTGNHGTSTCVDGMLVLSPLSSALQCQAAASQLGLSW